MDHHLGASLEARRPGSFFEIVPDPPLGRPVGGSGIHRT